MLKEQDVGCLAAVSYRPLSDRLDAGMRRGRMIARDEDRFGIVPREVASLAGRSCLEQHGKPLDRGVEQVDAGYIVKGPAVRDVVDSLRVSPDAPGNIALNRIVLPRPLEKLVDDFHVILRPLVPAGMFRH